MDDPVSWAGATITWSRNGYTLRVPLWADDRALALREDEANQAIWDALPERGGVAVSFYPMRVEEDASATRAEHGEVVITTDPMLSLAEAADLREALTQAFHGAVEDAEKQVATDDEAAASVLAVLRQNRAQAAGS